MNKINAAEAAANLSTAIARGLKVLVTGAELAPEATELLKRHAIEIVYADGYSGSENLAEITKTHAVDAILVRQGQINDQVIASSSRLRVIAKHGSGVDNIDLDAATSHNIPVLRALAANAQSVAELAITLSVTLMKDIGSLSDTVKGGAWPKTKYVGRDSRAPASALSVLARSGAGRRNLRKASVWKPSHTTRLRRTQMARA